MSTSPRILIADDHPDIINSLERRLRKEGYTVLKSVSSLSRLRGEIHRQRPDVAIVDVYFGRENALARLRHLRAACTRTRFVIYTGADDPALLACAVAGGASGFLLKLHPEELFACVESVIAGHTYIATAIRPSGPTQASPLRPQQLTCEQEHLYRLLHSGMKQAEIAVTLGTSLRTCERKVTSLSRALHLDHRGTYHIAWQDVRIAIPTTDSTDSTTCDGLTDGSLAD